MKELDGKTIRFVAVDKRYMRVPYPAVAPISKEMGTYVTGQHINPSDEDTHGNLTDAEMLGEIEIKPAARRTKFAYVINPDNPVFITHMKKYNCKLSNGRPVHPRDYAEAHFIYLQHVVAHNRDGIKPSKHYFFLEDKESESKITVTQMDRKYEAEKYIRESLSISEHKDIINLLNLKHPYFNENTDGLTAVRMFEVLLKTAHSRPQDILYMTKDEARDELFISKLVTHNIIKKRVDGFYDGPQFAARTLEEMVVLLHSAEGEALTKKWGKSLSVKE